MPPVQKRKRIQMLDSDDDEEIDLSNLQPRAKRPSQDEEDGSDLESMERNGNTDHGATGDYVDLKDWRLEPGVIEYVKVIFL